MNTQKHPHSLFLDLQYDYTPNSLPSPVSTFWISGIIIFHIYCINIIWSFVNPELTFLPLLSQLLVMLSPLSLKAKNSAVVWNPRLPSLQQPFQGDSVETSRFQSQHQESGDAPTA